MNFILPDQKEIRNAFAKGEKAVVEQFDIVDRTLENLGVELAKQAEVLIIWLKL